MSVSNGLNIFCPHHVLRNCIFKSFANLHWGHHHTNTLLFSDQFANEIWLLSGHYSMFSGKDSLEFHFNSP